MKEIDSEIISTTDSVTIVIKECLKLSTAMRKYSNFTSQSSVSALLSGSSERFYNDKDFLQTEADNYLMKSNDVDNLTLISADPIKLEGLDLKLKDANGANANTNHNPVKHNDPLLSGFIQLRSMLNKLNSLDEIDSLTLIQPFLLVIVTGGISTYITSLALDSLYKFLSLNIINSSLQNYINTYREIVNSIINCTTDNKKITNSPATPTNLDDTVLIKMITLLGLIINSSHFDILTDANVHDILTIIMSVACNKKKSELLRKNAEFTMTSITIKLFNKLNSMNSKTTDKVYINDESYSKDALKNVFGADNNADKESMVSTNALDTITEINKADQKIERKKEEEEGEGEEEEEVIAQDELKTEEIADENKTVTNNSSYDGSNSAVKNTSSNFGISVIKLYLNMLLSLITPENQARHTNSTKILALQYINLSIEISGDHFLLHPQLFNVISDPIFKSILFIIQNSNKLSLLQSALQLFSTLFLNLNDHLQMQIELTLNKIFEILLEGTEKTIEGRQVSDDKVRPPKIKELLIEQVSILWTRSPSFFTSIFINFDCNLDRSDIAINFLKALTKLALPESSITSTETVPPICLEGLISFIDDLYKDIQQVDRQQFLSEKDTIDLIKQRERKTAFIKCAKEFNEKPKNGIPILIEKGFIESDNDADIAKFLFENNTRVNKKQIGLLLCDPKKTALLSEFINLFDFKNLRVDEAIRILLTKFRLPGESQQIERIVEAFSSRYVSSQMYDVKKLENPTENDNSCVQPDSDSVFVLSYSIIMLNTDLHNPQVKEHMSFDDYSGNLKGCYNSNDFPHWYLDKIYCSIRDKEIVMPEEHHGDEKWFEDAWNNLISSTTVMTEITTDRRTVIEKYNKIEVSHFNRAIFKNVGPSILSTLFQIFVAASDEYITTIMLTTVEKCSSIASFFNFKSLFNDILRNISKITTLLVPEEEFISMDVNEIPLIEIKMEKSNVAIPVSTRAVHLGKSYKGQLSTVVYFRIIRRNRLIHMMNESTWKDAIKVLLNLYENLLFSPDIFNEFQKLVHLDKLPLPKAAVILDRNEESKGLFSAFASYLKGDEEPTADEIDASVIAMKCLRMSDIKSSLFGNGVNLTSDVIKYFLEAIPESKKDKNARFYDQEILFITEISIALFSYGKNTDEFATVLLQKLKELRFRSDISMHTVHRLSQYFIVLLSMVDNKQDYLVEFLSKELDEKSENFDGDYFASQEGLGFIHGLLKLSEISNYQDCLFAEKNFWRILKAVSIHNNFGAVIFEFLDKLLSNNVSVLISDNYFHILSLLDVISSLGSVGSSWEEEYANLVKSGHKVKDENPHKETISLSINSIDLCLKFLKDESIFSTLNQTKKFTLIQVLSHQCQNPCKQIRLHAFSSLENILCYDPNADYNLPVSEIEELIDGGFLPLLESNQSHITDILEIIGKIYISYLQNKKATNETFIQVLSVFNRFVDNQEVEKQLQQIIIDKKDIMKKLNLSSATPSPCASPVPTGEIVNSTQD